jgi:hypothetical protein
MEQKEKKDIIQFKVFKEIVLSEDRKGNIVFMSVEGPQVAPLDKFVDQHIDGLLYDLNRDRASILTNIEDIKWVNDFAVFQVITELKKRLDKCKKVEE